MSELLNILREKRKIARHYKKRLETASRKYSKKIDEISKRFEVDAGKVTKDQERRLKLLIRDYDKQFNTIEQRRSRALLPSLRKKVAEEVCEYYGFNLPDIITKNRGDQTKAECRQVIYYFLCLHKLGTLKEIGSELDRHPASLLSGIEAVNDLLGVDNVFKLNFNNIKEIIEDVLEESTKIT